MILICIENGMDKLSIVFGWDDGHHWFNQYLSYKVFSFHFSISCNFDFSCHRWADNTSSVGRNGVLRPFDHPFLQACGMFFGEFLCFPAFYVLYFYYKRKDYTPEQMPPSVSGSRDFNPLIFLPPALCDMTATSLMYIGLNLTYPSSFQMLRGALIIFTGLFSVAFLRRHLKNYEWIGIFIVIGGLTIVGLSDVLTKSQDASKGLNALITG